MNDRERVLLALREAGPRGLHSTVMRRTGLTGNPSQRVAELREMGYRIEAKGQPWTDANGKQRNGALYTLTDPALASAPETATSAPDSLRGVSGAGERGAEQSLFVPPERPSYMDPDAFEDAA